MKKVAILVVIALVLVCGFGGMFLSQQRAKVAAMAQQAKQGTKVERGELLVKVVETGTIDAVKAVDVRSRASGRLKRLLADEGDFVTAGQLIAIIDPLEIQLQVDQNRAQLSGARSAEQRTVIELEQRRVTAKAQYDQAVSRLEQLRNELRAQPTLTSAAVRQAEAALRAATQDRERLFTAILPNARTAAETELRQAAAGRQTAAAEQKRVAELLEKGYVAGRSMEAANLELENAEARLVRARAAWERLEGDQRLERMSADDNVRRAQADLDRALANRIQDANKKQEFDSAVAAVSAARAGLRDVEVLAKSRAQSAASVAQLSSLLSDSQRQLAETQVRAPMDGIVTSRSIEVGDLVTGLSAFSQGTAIFRVEDRRSMRVKLEINEIDVARLKLGMSAQIDVDAFPERHFSGIVKKIAPASTGLSAAQQAGGAGMSADNVVKYEVEIWLDKSDPALRSGMSAKCTIETLRRDKALRLPVEYVGRDKDGRFVMLAPKAGSTDKPKRQAVEVGVTTGSFIEILSGVTEGTRVVRPDYTGPARKGMMQAGADDQ